MRSQGVVGVARGERAGIGRRGLPAEGRPAARARACLCTSRARRLTTSGLDETGPLVGCVLERDLWRRAGEVDVVEAAALSVAVVKRLTTPNGHQANAETPCSKPPSKHSATSASAPRKSAPSSRPLSSSSTTEQHDHAQSPSSYPERAQCLKSSGLRPSPASFSRGTATQASFLMS